MNQNTRIGILLFLASRNELSPEEEIEFASWRAESPENELLFQELTDPENERRMMKEFYKKINEGREKTESFFPSTENEKLSHQAGYEQEPEFQDDEALWDYPDKKIKESGLSKLEFWAAELEKRGMISKKDPPAKSKWKRSSRKR
jgi:hypothetical protein